MRERDMPNKPQHPRLDALVDSTEAKFVSRYIVPALASLLLAVTGYAFTQIINKLDTLASNDRERAKDVTQIKSDVRDLTTRLDAGVLSRVNENTVRLDDHEARIRDLERAQNVIRPPKP